jgi:hypothetical protein
MDQTGLRQATGAAGRTVIRNTRNTETPTPLVSGREAAGPARDQEAAGPARRIRLAIVASDQIRLGTGASGRILLPVPLAGAARTARRRGRPAVGPGKDHRRAKEGVTARRGPPVAATAAGRKGLPVAATAAARRNGRRAGGRGAAPEFRRLAAR